MASSNMRCDALGADPLRKDLPQSLLKEGVSTWAEVDLSAICFNLKEIKAHLQSCHGDSQIEVFAAVKANAYGHGAVAVSQALVEAGASCLCVHRLAEGIELREAGIQVPVLVLGAIPAPALDKCVHYNLIPSVNDLESVIHLSELSLALTDKQAPVHLKVDTGMNRFGVSPQDALDFARAMVKLRGIKLQGVFTHFACADALDTAMTERQLDIFNQVLTDFNAARIEVPVRHAANSAALMRFPMAHFDAVRPGIALYGLRPSDQFAPPFELKPALALKSRIVQIKQIGAHEGISYGHTFVSARPLRIALIPLGYGDGYHRRLSNMSTSNRSAVLVRGLRAPILGRICMDQLVVDVTHIPNAELEDEVVAIGHQGQLSITAEELAASADTINYEVTTSILPRVFRVYV